MYAINHIFDQFYVCATICNVNFIIFVELSIWSLLRHFIEQRIVKTNFKRIFLLLKFKKLSVLLIIHS